MPTYKNESGELFAYVNLKGNSDIARDEETFESYKIYSVAGITKTGETPYLPLQLAQHDVVFAAAEDKTVPAAGDLLAAKVLRVTAVDVALTIKPNVAANTYGYSLSAGESIDIANDHEISALVLTSAGVGSATVRELPE